MQEVRCRACQHKFLAREESFGQAVRCPACFEIMLLPLLDSLPRQSEQSNGGLLPSTAAQVPGKRRPGPVVRCSQCDGMVTLWNTLKEAGRYVCLPCDDRRREAGAAGIRTTSEGVAWDVVFLVPGFCLIVTVLIGIGCPFWVASTMGLALCAAAVLYWAARSEEVLPDVDTKTNPERETDDPATVQPDLPASFDGMRAEHACDEASPKSKMEFLASVFQSLRSRMKWHVHADWLRLLKAAGSGSAHPFRWSNNRLNLARTPRPSGARSRRLPFRRLPPNRPWW
jgi:phage FluMu protein Com